MMGGSPRPSNAHPKSSNVGLKVIYEPPEGSPTADIICVHGLGGDVFGTWTSAEPEKTFWPRDLLPAKLPNVRILSYGYNSIPAGFLVTTSTNNIHQHAKSLVNELYYFRGQDSTRPIIWVCHSLGGLLVKRAMIHSNQSQFNYNYQLKSVKTSTYGIAFLGTPHNGSALANYGKWSDTFVRIVAPRAILDSNSALIKTLTANSETLEIITEQFLPLASDIKMFFFWEELRTRLGTSMELIVEQDSAAPKNLTRVGESGIHATHSEMCKFADASSPGWSLLSSVLEAFEREAPKVIEGRWRDELDRQRLELGMRTREKFNELAESLGMDNPPVLDFDTGGVPLRLAPQPDTHALPHTEPKLLPGSSDVSRQTEPPPYPFFKPPTLQENHFSIPQEEELAHIDRAMKAKKSLVVISDTGRGKTHLAKQYFFSSRWNFPGGSFWLDGQTLKRQNQFSTEWLDLQFQDLAEQVILEELPETLDRVGGSPFEGLRRKIITWFETHHGWLLVLDGLDIAGTSQLNEVARYIPKVAGGSILITTVNRALAGEARLGDPERLELKKLEIEPAMDMFFHTCQLDNPSNQDREAAKGLMKELDCMPLMINLAGTYIKARQMSVVDYLRSYKKRPFVEQSNLELESFHYHFRVIEKEFPEADNLLRILCFFEQQIPLEMLLWGIKQLPREHQRSFLAEEDGRRDINNTLSHLLAHSLIERSPRVDGDNQSEHSTMSEPIPVDTLRFSSVAQDICIARMKHKSRASVQQWLELAIEIFCHSFDFLDIRRKDGEFLISDYKRYVLHGKELMDHALKHRARIEHLGEVLDKVTTLAINDSTDVGNRRSMFRSGSVADSSSFDSLTPSSASVRTDSWPLGQFFPPEVHSTSPVDHRFSTSRPGTSSGLTTISEREQDEAQWRKNLERFRKENAQKPFKLRYQPPPGLRYPPDAEGPTRRRTVTHIEPRSARSHPSSHVYTEEIYSTGTPAPRTPSIAGSSAATRSPTATAALQGHLQSPRAQAGARGDATLQRAPTGWARLFGTGQATHYNPLRQGMAPVVISPHIDSTPGRNRSGSLPTQGLARSAPAEYGLRFPPYGSSPALSDYNSIPPAGSPAVGHPHAPFMSPPSQFSPHLQSSLPYTPMPPYPITPAAERADPFNSFPRPAPFTYGYVPDRDISNSPIARAIVGPRDTPPSDIMSEPILEDNDFFSPQHSTAGGTHMRRDFSAGSGQGRGSRSSSAASRAQYSRSPSPMAFPMDPITGRRISSTTPQRNSPLQRPAVGDVASPYRPPPPLLTDQHPQIVESPATDNSTLGLGIDNVALPFQTAAPIGHTRHASLGDMPTLLELPRGKGKEKVILGASPLRRSSVPEVETAESVDMVRSRSEPGNVGKVDNASREEGQASSRSGLLATLLPGTLLRYLRSTANEQGGTKSAAEELEGENRDEEEEMEMHDAQETQSPDRESTNETDEID